VGKLVSVWTTTCAEGAAWRESFLIVKSVLASETFFQKADAYRLGGVGLDSGGRRLWCARRYLPFQGIRDNECRAIVEPTGPGIQNTDSPNLRASMLTTCLFRICFLRSGLVCGLMRGKVLDDFRNRLVDILQAGVIQSAQRCVGLRQPQCTMQYLIV
jgi:hypothetical protein